MDKGTRQILIIGGLAFVSLTAYLIYLNERDKRRHERWMHAYYNGSAPTLKRQPMLSVPQKTTENRFMQLLPKPKPQPSALEELKKKALWVKHQIEHRKGFEQFYDANKRLQTRKLENIMQHIYDVAWYGSIFNYDKEVNNGGGPVDGVASLGANNKALIEFKIAANATLEGLLGQVEVYKNACRTKKTLAVFVCFKDTDISRVEKGLKKYGMENDPYVVVIDARYKEIPASRRRLKLSVDSLGRIQLAS